MKSALGFLGWSPAVFWEATMYEYTAAIEGMMMAKGVKQDQTMSRNELLDLLAKEQRATKAG